MAGIGYSIVAFVIAISVLVAVHEYGHYWAAQRVGIKALRFSIGFGRVLWSRRMGRDKTEFVISAIPLGGYVKLLDEREAPVPDAELHRAFNRAPIPARMAVLVAGPLFNFLFAIAAYWFIFVVGISGVKPVIGHVETDSLAWSAGLEAGDEIVDVNGVDAGTWSGASIALYEDLTDDGIIQLRVRNDRGTEKDVTIDARANLRSLLEPDALFSGLGFEPWRPTIDARIGEVLAGGPAESAGMLAGDLIVASDGEPVPNWSDWVELVRSRPGDEMRVTVDRGGEMLDIDVLIGSEVSDGGVIGRVGVAVQPPAEGAFDHMLAVQQYGPLAATGHAARKTWDVTMLTLRLLGRMVVGDISVKHLSGPINIAAVAGVAASIGIIQFLSFLSIISISLGIINLMPIPMLDGGQLVYQLVELVKGSPVSERTQLIGQQIGIVLLLMLMSFAFYNDIVRLMG